MTGKAKPETSKSDADAAREELKDEPKTLEFKALTLELPAELPEALMFDFVELETAGNDPRPIFRILRSILGPEQFLTVRHALDGGQLDAEEIPELIEGILDAYGMNSGESEASQGS
jgi:hypothetical protein